MIGSNEGIVTQSNSTIFNTSKIIVTLFFVGSLTPCLDDKWNDNNNTGVNSQTLVAFDPDGKLDARINWTTSEPIKTPNTLSTDSSVQTSYQSSDEESPHFDDQSRYYSESGSLRKIHFKAADIEEHSIDFLHVVSN